ncbi:peptidoglycan DD-metalloendopeptidase family protein [candidate division WOR-3 bacterium]|nr:peptidoglycan DD-metalloendopeptidase family protein [candidate division WOR-3 bacterium]
MDIILVSSKRNKTANLRVKATYLVLIVIGVLVIVASFFYNLTRYARKEVDRSRLSQLESENRIVQKEIKRIEGELSGLQVLIDSLEQYDKELRSYAPLRPIAEELREMGIGGYAPDFARQDISPKVKQELADVSESLDNLVGRARLQRQSYDELVNHLQEKAHLRDHTPSIIPVQGWMIRGYGYHIDPFTGQVKMHEGLDIAAPIGTPIVSPADGMVRFAGERKDYGQCVEIDHGYGFMTVYAHCQRLRVNAGMRVRRGDIIAHVGTTGRSTGPHLHYEVRLSHAAANPLNYILSNAHIFD